MSAPPIPTPNDAARATHDSQRRTPLPAPARFASLADLIAPLDAATFAAAHRESSPALVARSSPDFYRALFSTDDLDFVVSLGCQLGNSSVELLGSRDETGAPRFPENVSTVFAAYRAGASVRVIGAQRYWKPLWTLCRELQQELSFPVRANLYLTPPGAQGAELHYDTHDVFVLQIAGHKRWRVFAPVEPLALEQPPAIQSERPQDVEFRRGTTAKQRVGLERGACGEPLLEATLEAGDLLYVPRAFVHEAETETEPALHVSVGVHALTWTDAFAVALGRRANADERLRASLPSGFAHSGSDEADAAAREELLRALLADFASGASAADALAEIAANSVWDRQALCDGALFDSRSDVELGADTPVERRPGLNFVLAREAGGVVLRAGHAAFNAPAPLASAFEFVARTPRFRVAELPGGISDAGKIALARRLVREGFLRVARAD